MAASTWLLAIDIPVMGIGYINFISVESYVQAWVQKLLTIQQTANIISFDSHGFGSQLLFYMHHSLHEDEQYLRCLIIILNVVG